MTRYSAHRGHLAFVTLADLPAADGGGVRTVSSGRWLLGGPIALPPGERLVIGAGAMFIGEDFGTHIITGNIAGEALVTFQGESSGDQGRAIANLTVVNANGGGDGICWEGGDSDDNLLMHMVKSEGGRYGFRFDGSASSVHIHNSRVVGDTAALHLEGSSITTHVGTSVLVSVAAACSVDLGVGESITRLILAQNEIDAAVGLTLSESSLNDLASILMTDNHGPSIATPLAGLTSDQDRYVGRGNDALTNTEGASGPEGPQGIPGVQGDPGAPGADGDSAYDIAVAEGFAGTEAQWLASLVGAPGEGGGGGSSTTKRGRVPAAGFQGSPRQYEITFAEAFGEAPAVSVAVEVASGATRYNVYTTDITASGFTLDLGSETDLANLVAVYWAADLVTETYVVPPVPAVNIDGFFLGHSLLNFEMPQMVDRFVEATANTTLSYDIAVGVGANLQFQWNNPANAGGDNPSVFLQAGPYDVLVLTEATPIANQIVDAASATNALNFIGLAYAENASVKPYLYEVWDGNVGGLPAWRYTVDENRKVYEEILEDINTGHPGETVLLIPGGQAIGALYDAAAAAEVPSFTTGDIFEDTDGHLTDTGNYFIACVFFATIYQRTPVGLPATILDAGDGAYDAISAPTAAALQEIAWRVVQADPLSGVSPEDGVPTVVDRSPAVRATDVALDGTVVVTFSEAMDPATITTSTVYIVAGGAVVAASIGYSGVAATITPDADLTADTEYTVVVTRGAESAGDNTPMGAHSAWTFETGSGAALPAPEFNTSYPTPNEVGASRFVGITFYFFQDIDASTVDASSFIVTETAGGTVVPGTRSVTDGDVAFSPTVAFSSLTEYRVQLLATVEGLPPRGPIAPFDYTFTTN